MLIPYNTDAPIYHLPIATVSLIVVNVLVFLATMQMESADVERWILQFDTINPVQWVTNNFLHANLLHVLGNMFFLWGFGLVVEGKLGWLRFFAVYFLMGIVYSAIIQISMFAMGGTSGALGASAVIFGLLAMAVVWAPRNEMNCLLLFGMYTRPVEISILGFGGLYLAFQIVPLFFGGFHMSSEVLHLAGVAIGFPIGALMVKQAWVDCEGWDLFNVLRGRETKLIGEQREEARALASGRRDPGPPQPAGQRKKRKKIRADDFEPTETDPAEVITKSILHALQEGNVDVALSLYRKQTRLAPHWTAPDQVIANLIQGLHREKRWQESVPFMVDILHRLPDRTAGTRIKLAQIMLQVENRPRQALRLLDKLPTDLADRHRKQARALRNAADKAASAGDVELFVEDW